MLEASVKNPSGMKAKHLWKTVVSRLGRPIYASAGEAMLRDSNEEAWVLILAHQWTASPNPQLFWSPLKWQLWIAKQQTAQRHALWFGVLPIWVWVFCHTSTICLGGDYLGMTLNLSFNFCKLGKTLPNKAVRIKYDEVQEELWIVIHLINFLPSWIALPALKFYGCEMSP